MKSSVLDAPVRKTPIFVLPGLIVYATFVLGPILAAVYLSSTRWNGISAPEFVGAVATWYYFGFFMVVFLTGLQRIDPSIFEAARADGAKPWYTFRRITAPLLLPEIRIVLVLTIIASIKSFDLIFTMTRGGPANATLVPNIYMYQLGFQLGRYGDAAAVAIIGAILIFIVNYAVHRLVRPAKGAPE